MSKPTLFIWMLIATTLAGILITVVLLLPSLAAQQRLWITAAVIASAVLALPFSVSVTKALIEPPSANG